MGILKSVLFGVFCSTLAFAANDSFQVQPLDGPAVTGQLLKIQGAKVTLKLEDGEKNFELGDLWELRREGAILSDIRPNAPMIVFGDGDRVFRSIKPTDDPENLTTVDFRDRKEAKTVFSLSSFRGIAFNVNESNFDQWFHELRDGQRKDDVVWLTNNDRLTGGLIKIGEPIVMLIEKNERKVEYKTANAVAFSNGLDQYPLPEGPFLEVTLMDGSRLGFKELSFDEKGLHGKTRADAEIQLPASTILKMQVRQPKVKFLADLKEDAAQFSPYLAEHVKRFGKNETIDRRVFRVNGEIYDRGLGTHPRTLLAYKLKDKPRFFKAKIAMDDKSGDKKGSFKVRVLLGKKELFVSQPVTLGSPAQEINVDVSEGGILILSTEFGANGDTGDHADWLEARLVY